MLGPGNAGPFAGPLRPGRGRLAGGSGRSSGPGRDGRIGPLDGYPRAGRQDQDVDPLAEGLLEILGPDRDKANSYRSRSQRVQPSSMLPPQG